VAGYHGMMADPRIYQVCLANEADASLGLSLARRFIAACGKQSARISAWASLMPSSLPGVAALLPHEILSADITLEPSALASLVDVLRAEPQAHNWSLAQRASAFGSALGVGTRHPSQLDWASSSTVSLDFGDDPVPEAIANGRFGRWLEALASAGLLPARVSVSRLMDRFADSFPPRSFVMHRTSPMPAPFTSSGVRVSARGWRTMRGDRDRCWPGACLLAIPTDPVTALERAARLFALGGPVEFHGYYTSATLGRTGLASRFAAVGSATFVLHTIDSEDADLDEAMVGKLLAITGDDLVCVDWQCDWPAPDAVPGYNGVQLTVNGVGNLHEGDPEHVPGTITAYLTVHPVTATGADALAARLAKQAEARLVYQLVD